MNQILKLITEQKIAKNYNKLNPKLEMLWKMVWVKLKYIKKLLFLILHKFHKNNGLMNITLKKWLFLALIIKKIFGLKNYNKIIKNIEYSNHLHIILFIIVQEMY